MTHKRELEELTAWVRSQGGDVLTITGAASIYEDGSACFQVVNLPGCGPHPMGDIAFAECIRKLRARNWPEFDVYGFPPNLPHVRRFAGRFTAENREKAIESAKRSGSGDWLDLQAEPVINPRKRF